MGLKGFGSLDLGFGCRDGGGRRIGE